METLIDADHMESAEVAMCQEPSGGNAAETVTSEANATSSNGQPESYKAYHLMQDSRTPAVSGSGCTTVRLSTVCILLGLQTVVFAGVAGSYLMWTRRSEVAECLRCFREAHDIVHEENRRITDENERLKQELVKHGDRDSAHPYETITGSVGHELPEMYGKVKEKTIWSYWYDPMTCPDSEHCALPPQVQLCVETVGKNRGGFDYRIVHIDEVPKYVNWLELPVRWRDLRPAHQKDALMNALLARYGGVAIDISTILLRPLDDYWEEMVSKKATFRGYMYRLNGLPWRHAEVTVVWFLMARREGIFSTAVRSQVIGMGDRSNTKSYHHWYLALGDQTLLPILSMFNYSLPKCYDDATVQIPARSKLHQFPDQNVRWCPEKEQPPWYKGLTGPERTDTSVILRDPRDGPQLPFAFLGMIGWHVHDGRKRWRAADQAAGSPMYGTNCSSPKDCWENVFLARYNQRPRKGEAPLLSFVKLFHHGSEFRGKTREQMLSAKTTFFYQFLKLAGVVTE